MQKYFSKIDNNGVVIDIRYVDEDYMKQNSELYNGKWIETFRDGGSRKNFGTMGTKYDQEKDVFIPEKPFESWILNLETFKWDAPVKYPEDGQLYYWDESAIQWVKK